MACTAVSHPPHARSFLPSFVQIRNFSCATTRLSSHRGSFPRSDFPNQGYSGYYDAGAPTIGPLADASLIGAPRITPRSLKQHLDLYVIGQERAKKILSVAVYNHYQRVQELQRREEEEEQLLEQQSRREWTRHPVEDEFPGQQATMNMYPPPPPPSPPQPQHFSAQRYANSPIVDESPLNIEKSNVLMLGPSGVGKTLMAKTLARVLEVPFSMSDCTPFTQAGYIGEDAEVCVQRLLAAANYDVARAERGIICLDEIDKIATTRVSHGKDVSGEGVQQALLKIIEGTTIQVQAKQERASKEPGSGRSQNAVPTSNPLGGGNTNPQQPGKGEVYNISTENILFICTGAFIGLHKAILDRIAKGSIGFGAQMRSFAASTSSSVSTDANDPTIPADDPSSDELFRKHLPFYDPPTPPPHQRHPHNAFASPANSTNDSNAPYTLPSSDLPRHNTLDLTTPADLQKYGLIPELIGRLPITCALSPLSLSALVRVLTEPRNSLVAQYVRLFALSNIELRFTSPSLYEIAKQAQGTGTGARGLRTVMERLLGESMYECPGQGVRYVLVTERAARREEGCRWFGRGSQATFAKEAGEEEETWERERSGGGGGDDGASGKGGFETFSEYREKAKVAGSG